MWKAERWSGRVRRSVHSAARLVGALDGDCGDASLLQHRQLLVATPHLVLDRAHVQPTDGRVTPELVCHTQQQQSTGEVRAQEKATDEEYGRRVQCCVGSGAEVVYLGCAG